MVGPVRLFWGGALGAAVAVGLAVLVDVAFLLEALQLRVLLRARRVQRLRRARRLAPQAFLGAVIEGIASPAQLGRRLLLAAGLRRRAQLLPVNLDIILTPLRAIKIPQLLCIFRSSFTLFLFAFIFVLIIFFRNSNLNNFILSDNDMGAWTPRVPVFGIAFERKPRFAIFRRNKPVRHILSTKLFCYFLLLQIFKSNLFLPHPT